MNNATLLAICWMSVAVHLAVGVLACRRASNPALLPVLNLVVALCTLAYWVPRWYSYLWKGITWYASDQLVPLHAALVCALVMFMLTGRYGGAVPHWIIFAIDALVFLAAALFFTFFQMERLF